MAGIGIKLRKIYEKNTIASNLLGHTYSTMVTVAPMFLIIVTVFIMGILLGYDTIGYARRALFSGTVLYIFIFSILTSAPFNAVLSRYMSDIIYEERYEDIMPCYEVGLLLNLLLSCLLGIPFCIWEYVVGQVNLLFVFTGFCGYISLVLVFYSMLYLSICKDYQKISVFFLLGMLFSIGVSLLLVKIFHREIVYSMLLALTSGFFLIAVLEFATVKRYFRRNSNRYRPVLYYFKKYWKLIFINFLYTLGLYIHNFVFWNTDMGICVANSFVYAPTYDMATFLAMFTNISATIILITRVEMYFHERYRAYSEAVIGGRWADIENAKNRMFRKLSEEVRNLARMQFIISTVIYLLVILCLPYLGYSGRVLWVYPCLAAGYFILFLFYSEIIFLYYFNDLNGALLSTTIFCAAIGMISYFATKLTYQWYGIGLAAGSFLGFTVGYFRLRWIEKNIDIHTFCTGTLFPTKKGKQPDCVVYQKLEPPKV